MRFSGRLFQHFTLTGDAGPDQGTDDPLFADTEAGKNAVEQVFNIDHPDHSAKTVGSVTQILCGKFGCFTKIMAECRLQRGVRRFNRVPVPQTRDHARLFSPIGRNNQLAQRIKNGCTRCLGVRAGKTEMEIYILTGVSGIGYARDQPW
jgi:hypothetical protein